MGPRWTLCALGAYDDERLRGAFRNSSAESGLGKKDTVLKASRVNC